MSRCIRHAFSHRCRRLLLQDDGAVTVFAVIVLSTLQLFFSLLIDYARIAAFHKLTEDAVRSSVRSVLSAYDSTLYEKYGLFGRGGTEGQTIFSEVMGVNVEGAAARQQAMKLVRSELDSAELHTAAFLGNHDVFARQILEEMKYKAPVDFTIELAVRFAPIAGVMKEASAAINLLESMRKQYEKREAHLARALELQRQAAAVINGSGIDALIPAQTTLLSQGGNTALHIAGEYNAYAMKVMHDQSLSSDEEPKYTVEIEAYEEKARALALELRRLSATMQTRHETLLDDALKELEAAGLLNEEMQRLVQQANQAAASSGYDTVAGSNVAGSNLQQVPADAASRLEQVKQSADKLILPDGWFHQYSEELGTQAADATAILMEAGSFQSLSSASLIKPIASVSADPLVKAVTSLRLAYGVYEQRYIQPASVLLSRNQTLENGNIKAQLQQQEEQAGSLWQQARGMLNGLTALPHAEEHIELFGQVEERYSENLMFNKQFEPAVTEAEEERDRDTGTKQANDAHEAAELSAASMDGLFNGLGSMLERTRDTLYYGEYVVHRFTSFAPQNLRAMFTEGDATELSQAVSFNNQEAEYAIYGFHNPVANIAAAYGELFATRLAVRTMEGLIQSRSLGHPLLILSAALIYGLEKTMEDMLAFTERGSAPLSKYVNVELSYTDYLRLFMLMHSANEDKRLARMIAVIEQNSGAVLSAVPSGVTGEAQVSMELWFVPGLMRVLGQFGLLQGKVDGNRYETTQTIGWSY